MQANRFTQLCPHWGRILLFVFAACFLVAWSLTRTSPWAAAGHSRESVVTTVLVRVIWHCHCFSVRPGGTPQTGRPLSACGRKGSKEWQNWELWSTHWNQMSLVLTRCRTAGGSRRLEGSTAERNKERSYTRTVYCQLCLQQSQLYRPNPTQTLSSFKASYGTLSLNSKSLGLTGARQLKIVSGSIKLAINSVWGQCESHWWRVLSVFKNTFVLKRWALLSPIPNPAAWVSINLISGHPYL